jgi:hypothetical protein
MTTFSRHCTAAAMGLADSSLMFSAGDRGAAALAIGEAVEDIAVCIRELNLESRPLAARKLASQLRRIADGIEPAATERRTA